MLHERTNPRPYSGITTPLARSQPLTLDQIIAIWFDAKTKRTRSHETERAYASRLAEFRDVLRAGGLDLDGDPHQVAALAQGWATIPIAVMLLVY